MVALRVSRFLTAGQGKRRLRERNLRSCPLSLYLDANFRFALLRERSTNETKIEPDRRLPGTRLISPERGVFFTSGHDPLKQLETPSFGKCLHLMAWSDMMSSFFSRSLNLFIALLQSPLHGRMGFCVPLQGGAKTEHRKGSIDEEHPALTSGASLLATAIASSWLW